MKITHVALTLADLEAALNRYLTDKLGDVPLRDVVYVRLESHGKVLLEVEDFETTNPKVICGDIAHRVR